MNLKYVLLGFLLVSGLGMAQVKKSKADILFFEYAYREAIQEYYKEMNEAPLTNQQVLNLADSFYKIGNFKQASDKYFEVYKKDSTMSDYHFSKMLVAMTRTSGLDRAKAFLATKTTSLSPELVENAAFNFELRDSEIEDALDFKIFNINANSPQADFGPSFFGDRLLFSSSRPQDSKMEYGPSGEGFLNIYVGKVGRDGQVINPNPYTGIPETKFHAATPFYSKQLNSVFYVLSNAVKGKLSFDENGKNALALGISGINGDFNYLLRDLSTSFYYPFYDEENSKLYFAANFEDSLGGTDIYYVYTNNGQIMSSPINLGPRINSPGNEISPYVFENTLYFSSDIFYGLGGMDIYKSEIGSDDVFSIPINLGDVVNSEKDEFGFIIKNNMDEGLIGYFSSNRAGGKGNDDIYGYLVDKKPGLKTLVIRGEITEETTTLGIPGVTVKLLDEQGELLKETSSGDDGTYRLEVPWRNNARIALSKDRYSRFTKDYDEAGLEKIEAGNLDISLVKLDALVQEREGQTVIRMNKFFFDRGSSKMTPEIETELDKAVDAVMKFPEIQLRVEAHTDSRGGSATNFRLSQKRADAIKKYLLDKGVPDPNILYSIGYGEDKITNNCTNGVYCLEILHKQNERHLIVVLNYDLLYD
ncbi:MAG: OmpA family protein [Eudoraea sp.]|nr:OmpA family protein [Eudoraea sp.]